MLIIIFSVCKSVLYVHAVSSEARRGHRFLSLELEKFASCHVDS